MFSFGQFADVLVLISDVSEPSIISIFMCKWMKNDWYGTWGVFIPEGVEVGKWRNQWEGEWPDGAGGVTTGCGTGRHIQVQVRVGSLLCTLWLLALLKSIIAVVSRISWGWIPIYVEYLSKLITAENDVEQQVDLFTETVQSACCKPFRTLPQERRTSRNVSHFGRTASL